MYVYEEMIDGEKLTEIINTRHENVKYLPGHKLPDNVVSIYINDFYNIVYYSVTLFITCNQKKLKG